jgi:hypothetical protein
MKLLNWLERMEMKDKTEADREKTRLIHDIKNLKKEDILPKKAKKITIWMRIKKVLMG